MKHNMRTEESWEQVTSLCCVRNHSVAQVMVMAVKKCCTDIVHIQTHVQINIHVLLLNDHYAEENTLLHVCCIACMLPHSLISLYLMF